MADPDQPQIQPQEIPTALCIGHHESQRNVAVTPELLGQANLAGYDMITAPLTTPHFQSRVLARLEDYVKEIKTVKNTEAVPLPTISPLMPEDTDMGPDEGNIAIIGVVSPWIDIGSTDPLLAHVSRQVFALEVAYAAFVGIGNVIVHGPIEGSNHVQYARAILEGLGLGPYVQVQILLPMTGELELEGAEGAHLSELAREKYMPVPSEEEPELFGTWETWNTIRTMGQYSNKLTVALELPRQLPSLELQSRWFSEPVRTLVLPRTTFLRNQVGYPVLDKGHQQLLSKFLRLKFAPWVLLADVDPIEAGSDALEQSVPEPTPAEAASTASKSKSADALAHLRYIRRLQQTQPARPQVERFGQGYQDYIQSPLQPLTDNLESITYEVFEKDPVKYEWYERAVAAALRDIRAKLGDDKRPIVCAVAGAGRGPLVTRVLRASKSTGISIVPCAVEKNPNAHVLIQRRNTIDPLWNKQVLVYKSDMRSWPGPTIDGEVNKVDILISELLGSFADNELSPECLDGVQHVLHPDHGVNIPQSYSAHLTPIHTPRLHSDLLSRSGEEKWELPAVVMLQQYDDLCRDPRRKDGQMQSVVFPELAPEIKDAWVFSHPTPVAIIAHASHRAGGTLDAGGFTGGDGKNEHNVRTCHTKFAAQHRGVCHGLAGYFESILYAPEDRGLLPIELSTNPITMDQKSKDMISWFPIFFPLKTPLHVPDDADIEVTMWRQTDDRKVWYEWIVEVYQKAEGKRWKLGASGLHSSRTNGCLMRCPRCDMQSLAPLQVERVIFEVKVGPPARALQLRLELEQSVLAFNTTISMA
ncbi:Protein arginine N-methyltransferase [Cercospora zeina]